MDSYRNYAIHLAVAFVSAYATALAALLNAGAITPATLSWTAVGAVLFASFSAALKGITEGVVIPAGKAIGGSVKNAVAGALSVKLEK